MTDASKSTKASVLVGCRFPAGLVLRIFKMVEQSEVLPGGRTQRTKVAAPLSEVRLRGSAQKDAPVAKDLRGLYGVTEVSREFWDEWVKQQGPESDLIDNHIVFAADTRDDLKAINREIGKEPTGLEPLDQKKPGERLGGRDRKKIEPAAEVEDEG